MSILDKVYTVKYKRREVVTRYQTRLLNFCWEDGFIFYTKGVGTWTRRNFI